MTVVEHERISSNALHGMFTYLLDAQIMSGPNAFGAGPVFAPKSSSEPSWIQTRPQRPLRCDFRRFWNFNFCPVGHDFAFGLPQKYAKNVNTAFPHALLQESTDKEGAAVDRRKRLRRTI